MEKKEARSLIRNIVHDNCNGIFIVSSSFINIQKNEIYYNSYDGISIFSSSFINVQENKIYYNMKGIWTTYSSNNTYVNNTVHDQTEPGGHGFFFSGTPYSDNKIIGNVVYNNDVDGIHLEDQSSIDKLIF